MIQADLITENRSFVPANSSSHFQGAQGTKFGDLLNKMVDINSGKTTGKDLKFLGTITKSKPTVSHLLIENQEYGKQCWDIIHSHQNMDKAYRKIPPGTTVYLNPQTREIVWGKDSLCAAPSTPSQKTGSQCSSVPSFHGLDKVVRSYMGRPYNEIDCYELVVQGLKDLGIQYGGTGGLKEQLVSRAITQGQPYNAYLTGEGLVQNSGIPVYTKTLHKVHEPEKQAHKIWREIEPLLQTGLLVSFSTPKRGHTGIVSRIRDTWTFINSGNMDHHVGAKHTSKGVGEEYFEKEVLNWLQLASSRGESLQMTIGRLSNTKLTAFLRPNATHTEGMSNKGLSRRSVKA